jgi:hypothetical protein
MPCGTGVDSPSTALIQPGFSTKEKFPISGHGVWMILSDLNIIEPERKVGRAAERAP